jgi:hypothetical protein
VYWLRFLAYLCLKSGSVWGGQVRPDLQVMKIGLARMKEEAFPFIEHMIKLKEEWDEQHQ